MTCRSFTWGYLLLVMLLLSLPTQMLRGQQPPEDVDLYEYANTTNVTIGFAGGTVDDFVKQVKTQAEGLNVLIRADVQKVMLPALSLRNITADTALNSLTPLSLEALTVEVDESQEYYIIGPNHGREIESVEVLNVGWFLSAGSENDSQENQEKLLSTIEAGQEMLATSSGTMKIYLHEKTGLLFVKGSNEEIELVQRIMQELLDQQQYMRAMKGRQTKPAGDIGAGAGGGGVGAGGLKDDGTAK